MRATYLNYRSPKELTPAPYYPVKTNQGLPLNRFEYLSQSESLRGTFSTDQRFVQGSIYNDVGRFTGERVGPGSYKDEEVISRLKKKPCMSTYMSPAINDSEAPFEMNGYLRVIQPEYLPQSDRNAFYNQLAQYKSDYGRKVNETLVFHNSVARTSTAGASQTAGTTNGGLRRNLNVTSTMTPEMQHVSRIRASYDHQNKSLVGLGIVATTKGRYSNSGLNSNRLSQSPSSKRDYQEVQFNSPGKKRQIMGVHKSQDLGQLTWRQKNKPMTRNLHTQSADQFASRKLHSKGTRNNVGSVNTQQFWTKPDQKQNSPMTSEEHKSTQGPVDKDGQDKIEFSNQGLVHVQMFKNETNQSSPVNTRGSKITTPDELSVCQIPATPADSSQQVLAQSNFAQKTATAPVKKSQTNRVGNNRRYNNSSLAMHQSTQGSTLYHQHNVSRGYQAATGGSIRLMAINAKAEPSRQDFRLAKMFNKQQKEHQAMNRRRQQTFDRRIMSDINSTNRMVEKALNRTHNGHEPLIRDIQTVGGQAGPKKDRTRLLSR